MKGGFVTTAGPSPPGLASVGTDSTPDPTWQRLEDQIDWYDRKSGTAQRWHKRVKVLELLVAAAVPPLAALKAHVAVVSALASIVVVVEGLEQLFQWNENWIAYRSTCEALKHERYLYLAGAGPYAGLSDPGPLLAERVESMVSQEHAKWASTQQERTRAREAPGPSG